MLRRNFLLFITYQTGDISQKNNQTNNVCASSFFERSLKLSFVEIILIIVVTGSHFFAKLCFVPLLAFPKLGLSHEKDPLQLCPSINQWLHLDTKMCVFMCGELKVDSYNFGGPFDAVCSRHTVCSK